MFFFLLFLLSMYNVLKTSAQCMMFIEALSVPSSIFKHNLVVIYRIFKVLMQQQRKIPK